MASLTHGIVDALHRFKHRYLRDLNLGSIPGVRQLRQRLIERNRMPVVDGINGHSMYLDAQDSLGLSWNKSFEVAETEFFRSTVRRGQVVLDVGANIGYFTLLFAKQVGPGGHVFSFEPSPANIAILEKNVAENGYHNVTIVPGAVSDQPGRLRLFLSEQNLGDHRIYDSGDGRASVEVEALTLDGFFKDGRPKIDVIKMDIQGAEFGALKGMRRIFSANPHVIMLMEFWPFGLRRFGVGPEPLLRLLAEYGLAIRELDEKSPRLKPVEEGELVARYPEGSPYHTNLLCANPEVLQGLKRIGDSTRACNGECLV